MMLEYGEGENREKLICRGRMTELQEARTGLAMLILKRVAMKGLASSGLSVRILGMGL